MLAAVADDSVCFVRFILDDLGTFHCYLDYVIDVATSFVFAD